ncbi:MAG: macro domain-containing protein [bacterium]|nr:macro domain-containing protein [bacterium]MDE0289480.1 macro domain-containing protein [bacterium]MDE0439878.1 macro domain-containing protein [bacterium]
MTRFRYVTGNLLKADVDALVNTVNTVGVMGKGLALQFKNAFPANFKAYSKACKDGDVRLGRVFIFDNGQLIRPRWILNFPTKGHWRARSRLSNVSAGLDDLRSVVEGLRVESIAVPPLGCGNGGLSWANVRPLIEEKLDGLGIDVDLYLPIGSPPAAEMVISTPRPDLTPPRAALVEMVHRYSNLAFGTSLVEVQKLMYFLQAAGEPLRLRYKAHLYGPYADNLRHVLKLLEGHYLRGFGDGSQSVPAAEPIRVLPDAPREALSVLSQESELVGRVERVLELVRGYESSYGLELLASVHWLATRDERCDSLDHVIKHVHSWSTRKNRMFTEGHIRMAWTHLQAHGWLTRTPA